jgi:hypothetical protein
VLATVNSGDDVQHYLLVARKVLLSSEAGTNAMIVVVEIASRAGTRAWKEYDAPSLNAAVEAAKRELGAYPAFRVLDIWIKRRSVTPER